MRAGGILRRIGRAILPALLFSGTAAAAGPQPPRILTAELVAPTERYGHDVLGGNEYAELVITFLPGGGDVGEVARIVLPEDRVFEDVEARLADVTGDGFDEVIVVEAGRRGGAELAVYGALVPVDPASSDLRQLAASDIGRLAATPPIGRRNRWLAPAGIADFDGDGQNDIAYVETPHIGGTLRIWTMRDGKLVQIASKSGFSNHRIGEDFITGGVRHCGQGPELVLPNFDWSRLMTIFLRDGKLVARTIGAATGRTAVQAALACSE